jgi:hypothetical protein
MTGGGLTIEVEEDGDMLVENAAAASLFSPGMWVQRPQRTPAAAAADAHDAQMADIAAEEQHRCVHWCRTAADAFCVVKCRLPATASCALAECQQVGSCPL